MLLGTGISYTHVTSLEQLIAQVNCAFGRFSL